MNSIETATEERHLPILPIYEPPHPSLANCGYAIQVSIADRSTENVMCGGLLALTPDELLVRIGDALFDDGELNEVDMTIMDAIATTLNDGDKWRTNDFNGTPLNINLHYEHGLFTVILSVVPLIDSTIGVRVASVESIKAVMETIDQSIAAVMEVVGR